MLILKDISPITKPFVSAVVTIGNFDGVHIGHQSLLVKTVKKAKDIGSKSMAITFDPHPAQITNNIPPKLITSYEEKNKLIGGFGIDVLLCIPFTKKFASLSAKDFVTHFLCERIGMKVIVIGKDYSFGKNREGNSTLLKKYASKFNFQVIIEEWIQSTKIANTRISSTAIRNMILMGNVDDANSALGRNYSMQGKVVNGLGIGRSLVGFPTANVDPDNDLYPKRGVYAVIVQYKHKTFKGVANIGYNPTFKNKLLTLEVHILSFDKEIYGEKIQIDFIKHLRDEKKFSSVTELSCQIQKDVNEANHILLTPLKYNNNQ